MDAYSRSSSSIPSSVHQQQSTAAMSYDSNDETDECGSLRICIDDDNNRILLHMGTGCCCGCNSDSSSRLSESTATNAADGNKFPVKSISDDEFDYVILKECISSIEKTRQLQKDAEEKCAILHPEELLQQQRICFENSMELANNIIIKVFNREEEYTKK